MAEALDVSILEIMRSERIQENHLSADNATEAISTVIDLVTYQRKIEIRNIVIALATVSALIMTIFLIDTMELFGFLMVCLPVIFLAAGVLLLVISWRRYKHKLTYSTTLILGILAIMFPVMLCVLLYFALMLGGPVPN